MRIAAIALLLTTLQQAPFSEVLDVRRHNVDVIVTDKQGNHVGGLRIEDFEVLEDGKPQEVTNFAEYADATVARVAATPGQTLAAAQTPPPRKFVLFIDDMNIHPMTRKKFANNVSDLVEKAMRPDDVAAVVRPTEPDKVALRFTESRNSIRADVTKAMDASRFRTNSTLQNENRLNALEDFGTDSTITEQRYSARRQAERVRQRVAQRLGNLRALVSALVDDPGRKIIVVATESLPAMPGREYFHAAFRAGRDDVRRAEAFLDSPLNPHADLVDFTPVIEDIARIASANGITIYVLQPEFGFAVPAPGSVESRTIEPSASDSNSQSSAWFTTFDRIYNTEDTMDILASKTGGKWFRGDARVDDAFREVRSDVQAYYSLAYRAGGGLDRPHAIAVRVRNRPDLHVRARNEVIRRSIANDVTDRVVASLVNTTVQNNLGIALEPVEVDKKRREATASVDVLVPLDKLMFVQDGDVHRARFTVHYAVSGSSTDFVSGIEPEQLVEIPSKEWEGARGQYWRYTLTMNMRRGKHRVGIGVLDPAAQEFGIATLNVDTR